MKFSHAKFLAEEDKWFIQFHFETSEDAKQFQSVKKWVDENMNWGCGYRGDYKTLTSFTNDEQEYLLAVVRWS